MNADPSYELSFEPLLPQLLLERALASHAGRVAVIDGDSRFTYAEFAARCRDLAAALAGPVTPVAVLCPNTHETLEAHFGVPMSGRALVTINTRLTGTEIAYILEHSEASTLIAHNDFRDAVTAATADIPADVEIVWVGSEDYERFIGEGHRNPLPTLTDERALLSISYTSGTTGRPKGVMYHNRGAYLQALSMVGHFGLSPATKYLWTLPMFHCNGWTFPWAVTAAGGTHVCLSKVDADEAWRLIDEEGVTHLCGAPTVLSMLAYAKASDDIAARRADQPLIRIGTGGAPPSPTLLERMRRLGFDVTHFYGLTETYGPGMICDWPPEWDVLDSAEQARLRARQGVPTMISTRARVITADGDAPADGWTVGEIAFRGNGVMLGYFKDPEGTSAAAPDGWFRSGDLGVMHADGFIELRDRSKDVIISGGENISSVEVEQAIAAHPAVLEVAVIGVPDARWGEVPAAYVTLHEGSIATAEEVIAHVRYRLAGFKTPKQVYFGQLPHTSTGKIQKFALRERAWAEESSRIRS
ncbi:acyl-CoA synthetase [Rhodococcus sp. SBT000017]|uniref:AMP-binding protein n=1 Tax=Rhodococcus sp. SBT000017 TaxID=1803385 RepID=UPI000EF8F788|nr:AMP-binding protein [Rhodococcus sp. SBT000017]RMB78065.1 acyl-CoA synthetase [Rhodococcus sp. SBT000017]